MEAKLKMTFTCEGGTGKVSYTYKYFDPEANVARVQALITAMIANGSIFEKPPLSAVSAQMITTSYTDYELPE